MTLEERLALALEFNKRFVASNYTNKQIAEEIILGDTLTQEQLDNLVYIYDEWKPSVSYAMNKYIRYEGKLYKIIQSHTSQSDWLPNAVASLYLEVQPKGVIPQFVQPTGAHDAYAIGAKVSFNGKVYESLINANTYSPTAYPQGWKLIV